MAEIKKMAAREGYGRALKALGEQHDNIVVLDADLAGSTKTAVFRKAFPERHINCGIAEANMVSVAAGLASVGYVAYVSSFAMFAAGRAFYATPGKGVDEARLAYVLKCEDLERAMELLAAAVKEYPGRKI